MLYASKKVTKENLTEWHMKTSMTYPMLWNHLDLVNDEFILLQDMLQSYRQQLNSEQLEQYENWWQGRVLVAENKWFVICKTI